LPCCSAIWITSKALLLRLVRSICSTIIMAAALKTATVITIPTIIGPIVSSLLSLRAEWPPARSSDAANYGFSAAA
jgi:hypothetical protein